MPDFVPVGFGVVAVYARGVCLFLGRSWGAKRLRYLETATEITSENNSTTIAPIPIDLFKPFQQIATRLRELPARASGEPTPQAAALEKVARGQGAD